MHELCIVIVFILIKDLFTLYYNCLTIKGNKMPGCKLNDIERRLKEWWDSSSTKFTYPILKGISIEGSPGLRGITNLDIHFEHPFSVISGQNGSGKTTLLAIAALAFHSPDGHHSYHARNFNTKNKKSYYTFVDFFFKSSKDPDISGVKITWRFEGSIKNKTKTIEKQSKKWMKYETRPKRPVHYFGVSRLLPAIEKNVLRSHFRVPKSQHKSIHLNQDFRDTLCRILNRPYDDAEVMELDKYSMRSCQYGSTYSSFNMGAGEDTLIELLYYLQEAPEGSLIVIEEIELALHPEAQEKLAEEIQKIAWKKKFQIIASTHSSIFIDRVPQISRIYIQRTSSTTHNLVEAPTTRYAMGFLHGNIQDEMRIYCEDRFENSFAERMIKMALPPELKRRVNVIGVGDKNQVATLCGAHVKGNFRDKYLGVFDGDVGDIEMKNLMKKAIPESNDDCYGNCSLLTKERLVPEKWALEEILHDEALLKNLSLELEEDITPVSNYLYKLSICKPHDIGYEFSKMTGLSKEEAESIIIKVACKQNNKFNHLLFKIYEILDGEKWFFKKVIHSEKCLSTLLENFHKEDVETVRECIKELSIKIDSINRRKELNPISKDEEISKTYMETIGVSREIAEELMMKTVICRT